MIDEQLEEYIDLLIPSRKGILAEMEAYAKEHQVPIMEPAGIEMMLQMLRLKKAETILEVGTAIGYSALRMAYALPNAKIVTIERDEERLSKARAYIKEANKESQILTIYGDALETATQVSQLGTFDAVFIDAAKGQYKRFFEIYTAFLKPGGMVITDNVLFKGLVATQDTTNKRIKSLVKKIDDFNRWLMSHPDYDTVILPVGDGVAISMKR
ncbi:Predicted O-methyltransferase YrrM [Mesobacillus persicus]|uniref:tRNA 5-hydroxyuridine methyltransferase n=1 Tax=Mesobacillus persicus TaxID=930146 RepID=A0A1H7XC93_9BACI|nr:O-methyltransferase [Mesobacillus persicus]SEM31244.1 Predicted O-methyltransferase YrrM [Mesobacillus persicus]